MMGWCGAGRGAGAPGRWAGWLRCMEGGGALLLLVLVLDVLVLASSTAQGGGSGAPVAAAALGWKGPLATA